MNSKAKEKTKKQKPLIVITAGGTGGHVCPAESLADELAARGYRLALATDRRGKDNYRGKLGEITNHAVLAGALVGKSKFTKAMSLAKTCLGIMQSILILLKNRPACVVGFGGYASFPCSMAASLLGIPLVIHEQNAVMSRTNRFLARRAGLIALSFKDTKFTPQDARTVLAGMPVRKAIVEVKNRPYPPSVKKFNLLILGGSQGSRIFTKVVPAAIKLLGKTEIAKLKIYQQCRPDDLKEANKAYLGTRADITLTNFFNNMPKLYTDSHLIISRAGASSVCEIAVTGMPSILVPLAIAADDHQSANARSLGEAGAAVVITEKDFTAKRLAATLKNLVANPKKLKQMSGNARKVGIPDAAKRFADALEKELKHGRKN